VTDLAHARSFGSVAERYDRYRPGYPDAAVVWALGEHPRRVVDVGAGTGILSRILHQLGHEVIAVEPDELMRGYLAQASPGVTALAGAAEEIPLRPQSVDAVVAAQSYHWFDPERAHSEVTRILRPDGVFAAFWNDADLSASWTVRFAELIDGTAATKPRSTSDFGPLFGPVACAEFHHEVAMTREDLVALATTRSPYLVATRQGQQDLVEAVRALIVDEGLAARFAMPHITRVHRAIRPEAPGPRA
jgi:SAM-dependent methyltransferase